MKKSHDLTVGSPMRVLPRFALPMIVSVIFQQLYNIADNIIAGQYLGDDALAAVSVSYPVTMIYMAIAVGMNVGASVVISQLFGAAEHSRMKTAISTAVVFTVVIALALTGLGLACMRPILRLLDTPSGIFGPTYAYLVIYTAGLLFIFLYNICTGIFTAVGDSVTPLVFLIISSVGNIFLDIAFVSWGHMGVEGCAWATFVCQLAAAVSAYIVLCIKLKRLPGKREIIFSGDMFRTTARLSVPSVLQQSFVSVGNLFVQTWVNGYQESYIIGGYGAAIKLNTFMVTIFVSMSSAMSAFTAQNVGADKRERVPQGWWAAFRLSLIVLLPVTVLYFFFGDIPMRLFATDVSRQVLEVGRGFLRIVSPFYVVVMVKLISDGVLRGAGVVKQFTATTFTDLLLRVGLAWLLPHWFGYVGIWMSWPVGWTLSAALAVVFYKGGKWKSMDILKSKEKH